MNIVTLIISCLIIFISSTASVQNFDQNKGIIPDGYHDVERYETDIVSPFGGEGDCYYKYYYDSENWDDFFKSKKFRIATIDEVKMIKKYFKNFTYQNLSKPDKYDFKLKYVHEGDFYYIEEVPGMSSFYRAYLLDTDTYILYYINIDYH